MKNYALVTHNAACPVVSSPPHARTSEVRSVRQTGGDLAGLGDDVDDALLYEVHLGADRALPDDVVARLKHLVLQLRYDLRHEVGVGVREERNGRHQSAAVEIDYFLSRKQLYYTHCLQRTMSTFGTSLNLDTDDHGHVSTVTT